MSEKNEWKLAEALRESLLWTASSLAAVGKEQDVIVLEGRKRTIGEILDEANAALDAPSAPGDAQDERQAFEAWAKGKKMPLARIGQQYDDFWVDHAWNGWQARAALAAPAAGDALDAQAAVRSLQRYGFGYADDGNGARYLSSLKRDDGAFLRRDEVLAALAAQLPQQGEA